MEEEAVAVVAVEEKEEEVVVVVVHEVEQSHIAPLATQHALPENGNHPMMAAVEVVVVAEEVQSTNSTKDLEDRLHKWVARHTETLVALLV